MTEAYTLNVDVAENSAIPFNNVTIQKGCTSVFSAPATIQLNKCGVYAIHFDASVTSADAGTVASTLYKAGVVQPQGQASANLTADGIANLAFDTLVQVRESNSCRCCDSPTIVQIVNTGIAATYNNANIVVTKVC